MRYFYVFAMLGLMTAVLTAQPALAQNNVMLIIDASGSMKEKVDGKTRISVAKKVVKETLGSMPEGSNLGLMVYGHRRAKDCTDLELMSPIGADDAAAIGGMVSKLDAKGETPIAEALTQAAKSFKVFKGQQNQIVLVTDGLEECKGDPCAAAQALKDANLNVAVNIVGFTLGDEKAKQLQCVTDKTGGTYYSAANAADLTAAMQAVQTQVAETVIVEEAKPKGFNGDLLAAENGGTLIYAPNEKWQGLNQNHANFKGATYGGEAVWSFKDGMAATFDQIEVLVPEASKYNLKDFEVLAADELDGPYRSLGEFSAKNVKMMPEGWQGFKFAETTARYVKVVFKTSQGGGYIAGNALKLIGTLDEDSTPAEKEKVNADQINLLTAKNGGRFWYGANAKWAFLGDNTDQFEKAKGATYTGSGVWSFKDGKAATFDRLQALVPKAYKYNLKGFELLVADAFEGPYRSIGEYTLKNTRYMPDGWQTISLPETTAHFVKVTFKTDQGGGYVNGNPLRLMGTVDESSVAAKFPVVPEGEDLIAESNGGMLYFGTNDEWKKLNQGTSEGGPVRTGEGVWAFKDEQPATIRAVQIYIPKADKYNLKNFEILVGQDGPTADFRSIGQFAVQNIRMMPDGWQTFTLPETTAKYIKLKTISSQGGGYISMNSMRVIGELNPAAAE